MGETDPGSESPAVLKEYRFLAEQLGISVEEAGAFLAAQERFGRIVGGLRERHLDRFADARVLYDPPSFLVRFVGGVPEDVDEAFAGVSYPVQVVGDGRVSEVALEALSHRIGELLMAEGLANYSLGPDTEHGVVGVTVPMGYAPSSSVLQALFGDPNVVVTTADGPIFQPEGRP